MPDPGTGCERLTNRRFGAAPTRASQGGMKVGERKGNDVVSMGGSRIYRHGEPSAWQDAAEEGCIEAITKHIEAHLGVVDSVFHEVLSDTVHVDVHLVRPTAERPYVRLVTSGMSDLPMTIPAGEDVPRFAELLVTLPGTWKLDTESFEDETWYWPLRLLKGLARLPHKHATWLGFGHTVPNGDPPTPYAPNTRLCGAITLLPISVPSGFHKLRIDEAKEITFYAAVPLFEEEMNLKLRSGTDALLDRFEAKGISDIVDPARSNVAKRRFGWF